MWPTWVWAREPFAEKPHNSDEDTWPPWREHQRGIKVRVIERAHPKIAIRRLIPMRSEIGTLEICRREFGLVQVRSPGKPSSTEARSLYFWAAGMTSFAPAIFL
jgi:hypothetical protein